MFGHNFLVYKPIQMIPFLLESVYDYEWPNFNFIGIWWLWWKRFSIMFYLSTYLTIPISFIQHFDMILQLYWAEVYMTVRKSDFKVTS